MADPRSSLAEAIQVACDCLAILNWLGTSPLDLRYERGGGRGKVDNCDRDCPALCANGHEGSSSGRRFAEALVAHQAQFEQ